MAHIRCTVIHSKKYFYNIHVMTTRRQVDGLVKDCSISSANALEILQSCTKPSKCLVDLPMNPIIIIIYHYRQKAHHCQADYKTHETSTSSSNVCNVLPAGCMNFNAASLACYVCSLVCWLNGFPLERHVYIWARLTSGKNKNKTTNYTGTLLAWLMSGENKNKTTNYTGALLMILKI